MTVPGIQTFDAIGIISGIGAAYQKHTESDIGYDSHLLKKWVFFVPVNNHFYYLKLPALFRAVLLFSGGI